jgi:hypothetical protein
VDNLIWPKGGMNSYVPPLGGNSMPRSHRQLKHPRKAGRVTVPGKPSDELAPGTLNSILKQAGLKER